MCISTQPWSWLVTGGTDLKKFTEVALLRLQLIQVVLAELFLQESLGDDASGVVEVLDIAD